MPGSLPRQLHAFLDIRAVQEFHVLVRVGITYIHMGVVVKIDRPVAHRLHRDLFLHLPFRSAYRQHDLGAFVRRQDGRKHHLHLRLPGSVQPENGSLLHPLVSHVHLQVAPQVRTTHTDLDDTSRRTVRPIAIHRHHLATHFLRQHIRRHVSGGQDRPQSTKKELSHSIACFTSAKIEEKNRRKRKR